MAKTGLTLELADVAFTHAPGAPVLRAPNLTVQPGSVVFVVGANGTGKTTLLRLLAGELRPASGRIALDGTAVHFRRKDIGFVRADFDLLDYIGARENIEFMLDLYGRPKGAGVISRTLDQYALATANGTIAAALSRGQRKKLQIIANLLIEPSVLLADEPLDGLDADARRAWWSDVARVAASGTTVIVALHDPDVAPLEPTIAIGLPL